MTPPREESETPIYRFDVTLHDPKDGRAPFPTMLPHKYGWWVKYDEHRSALAAALAAKQEEYQRGFNDGAAIREQELLGARRERDAYEAIINDDGSLDTHEEKLDILRDMNTAYNNAPKAYDAAIKLARTESRLAAAERDNAALRAALERIRQWDMLDATADGPYWKRELDAALARQGKPNAD